MKTKDRRHKRIRSKVSGTSERPRVAAFKSTRYVYLQAIDDESGRTIAYSSDRPATKKTDAKAKTTVKKSAGTRAEKAFEAGKKLGTNLKAKGIEAIVFDRGGFKYMGIIKSIAEGLRESGLKF